ncbi:hypothetical protein IFM89_028385 [Coptis chinensis]|uniref:Uncharacterized protein n=1 Tax=Coptis chinensis TaxID=261450 RepID=A0A835LNV6_9MAGN|nr:hypothetical protein IFM89_028385 [Coptis chinensis]
MIPVINKRQMGVRKEMACLFLLLLIILHLETSCIAVTSGRFARLRGGHGSNKFPIKSSRGVIGRNGDKDDGGGVFDVDKRRIHTGPNPLHNR